MRTKRMTRKAAQAWIETHAGELYELLGLRHWKIVFRFARLADPQSDAEVDADLPHRVASIAIDCSKIVDEKQLADTIRHEFIHLLVDEGLNVVATAWLDSLVGAKNAEPLRNVIRGLRYYAAETLTSRIDGVIKEIARNAEKEGA